MKEPTTEDLRRLIFAWLSNNQPSKANEFDGIIPIWGPNGEQLRTQARIRWNPLREYYEMDPVVKNSLGTPDNVALVLEAANFNALKVFLAEIGVHHFMRVYKQGAAIEDKVPNIPRSFFPTVIKTT